MLKEIFKTVPIPFFTEGQWSVPFFGVVYDNGIPPYIENLVNVVGVFSSPIPTLNSPTSIYLLALLNTDYWPSWAVGFYRFDGITGQLVKHFNPVSNVDAVLLQEANRSRGGRLYWRDLYQLSLIQFELDATAKAMPGEEPDPETRGYTLESTIVASHFEDMLGFSAFAVDELAEPGGRLLNGIFAVLTVYRLDTGARLFEITMPSNIVAVTLEDEARAYILLQNAVLVLFDYQRGEVLGAAKIPSSLSGDQYWNNGDVRIGWDATFRRLLVAETVPDNADGSCATCVRGYRNVPIPVRLTTPIPLIAPRRGRIIPVLSQVVGDMNEGVGGCLVTSVVTGAGSQVGITITDHIGNAITRVACEGAALYVSSPPDYDPSAGSPDYDPPNLGLIDITSSVVVYQPDPKVITPSGIPRPPADGGGGTSPDPGATSGPAAPNMLYILQQVLATRAWRLGEAYEDAPDGRGAFTEAAVTAMHDVDARFGHIDKNPGQNQYNGHAVDAINFKDDDGTTAEIYDIVGGGGGPLVGDIRWGFVNRSTANRALWYYPA